MKDKKIVLRTLCQVAMLVALEIVLDRFCSITTPITRIGFAFIPMALCGMLFGPVWAGAAYAIADLIGAALFSYAVFPGITLVRIVAGVLYGLFLHREELRFFPHMLLAALADQIVCTLALMTLVLSFNTGTPFFKLLVTRLPQAGILLALELILFPVLLQLRRALRKARLIPEA